MIFFERPIALLFFAIGLVTIAMRLYRMRETKQNGDVLIDEAE